jgi:phosphatidylethanolamine-binding protein (PEBP) family uncharacterized protein
MRRATWVALAAGVAALVSGCGGSSPAGSAANAPVTPGAHSAATSKVAAVAYVSGTPVAKSAYEHWLSVERALGVSKDAEHRALAFLLTSSWVLGEGAARHIKVSHAEVQKRLRQLEAQDFPKAGELQRYLSKAHETREDLLSRVEVELVQQRIAGQVGSGAKLTSFERGFHVHWKSLTSCLAGYVMEDCKQYSGGPEAGLSQSSSAAHGTSGGAHGAAGGSASGGSASSSSQASSSGEVYTAPGAFSIGSSAFAENGEIPAKYTCDGAGVSPPLSWQKVPAHAAELVLFAIDDSANGANGGIRWIVGGIDPASRGVAAGATPQGGIVGANSAGKAAYGPICPAKGHTDTVEFVLYALKKPIKLSPGFQPAVAEQEYGSTKDILGQAAVSYAVYHRP